MLTRFRPADASTPITAGVIAVDPTGRITTWNKTAEEMLGVEAASVLGKNQDEVFQGGQLHVMQDILESVKDRESVERQIQISVADQLLTVVVMAATLRDDEEKTMGVMVFLEDITQIQKVQRMEAWREVARRIAHEIKNPLTPIQLSAERLRKRYAKLLEGNGAILDKCTSTIIQQVDELKLAFADLGRGVETQADIYAATIAADAGFSSNGPAVFILGVLGYRVVSGTCDPFIGDDAALEACLLGATPEQDHPPLDVRAEIAIGVIDEGQDLTPLLDILDALSLG